MEYDDTPYVNEHGRAPRGRGTWEFVIIVEGACLTYQAPPDTRYAEARRLAKREGRGYGADVVALQP